MDNTNKEDKLLALTYVQAFANKDTETMRLIEETVDPLTLARESAKIGSQLAATIAITIDEKTPASIEEILGTLRGIYYDGS